MVRQAGVAGITALWRIKPFSTLVTELEALFSDPRLRQLFARYATYCGSSPFLAPATLMLVAHVEQQGVWTIAGGMTSLATAMRQRAESQGVVFHLGEEVTSISTHAGRIHQVGCRSGATFACNDVICNADPAALVCGSMGGEVRKAVSIPGRSSRSLSALTFCMFGTADGFPLHYHNVFFSTDYRREFSDIFRHDRLPGEPTVYVCAQDRDGGDASSTSRGERLFCLVNAPAVGDRHTFTPEEIDTCKASTWHTLQRCGLTIQAAPSSTVITTPNDFDHLFPATGGALYGQASHGWRASFNRPSSRTRIAGLYLAGGATHPGPGVPMAALSGRLAADSLLADRGSTNRSSRVAMPGGTSTQ